MSGTYIQTVGDVPALPGAPVYYDYDADLGAAPTTREWWHPDPGFVSPTSGNIATLLSQKATGGTPLSQAVAESQPLLVANQINGRPILRFATMTVGAPDRFLYTFPAAANLSWTKIMVLKAPAVNSGLPPMNIWTSATANAHRCELVYTSNDGEHLLCRGGAGLASLARVPNRPVDQFFLMMSSFDHVAGRFACSINGGSWAVAATGGVTVTGTDSGIGALPSDGSNNGSNFDLAMCALDTAALHLEANAIKQAVWKQMVRDDFGLTIA